MDMATPVRVIGGFLKVEIVAPLRSRLGLRLLLGVALALGATAAQAFQLGPMLIESKPGDTVFSAYVPVTLAPGEQIEYLIVDARLHSAGYAVASPLDVQLVGAPNPRIRLFYSSPIRDPNARIDLSASLGDARQGHSYAAVARPAGGANITLVSAPPPVPSPPFVPRPVAPPPPPVAAAPIQPPPVAEAPQTAAASEVTMADATSPDSTQPNDAVPPQSVAPVSPAASSSGGIYIRPSLDFAVEFGGDSLVTAEFSDGSTANVRAGTGVTVAAGAHIKPSWRSPYDLRVTFGYKYGGVTGSNTSIYLDRLRLLAVPSYHFTRSWWAGAGFVRDMNVEFHGNNVPVAGTNGALRNVRLNDANGATVEAGWRYLALTYTFIKYSDDFGDSFKGNSVGGLFTWNF
jgi:hypothetical protein